MGLVHSSFVAYPTPRTLNYWWTFGAILTMMLAVQIVTGVDPGEHYTPEATMASSRSNHRARRPITAGCCATCTPAAPRFLPRRLIHMFRGLYSGRTRSRARYCGFLGVIIYLLMMATVSWVRAAMGPDEFLGRHRHHQPVLRRALRRRSIVTLLWALFGRPTRR